MENYSCKFIENEFINDKSKDYKDYCDFGNIPNKEPIKKFYDNHLFRLSLKCKIQDKGEPITVILMNPSYADQHNLDGTLFNVKEYLASKGFSEFEVLNVFPIRMPNSDNLSGLMKKYDKNNEYQELNKKYIENTLKKSKKVLVAWGGKYHSKAKWMFDLLKDKELLAYGINKHGSPTHFAPQVYNKNKSNPLKKVKILKTERGKIYFE